jgi:hypothetical protein
MSKIQIDADGINKVLADGKPTSLTQIWKCLGGNGAVPGSTAKRMREALPNIMEVLAANKGTATPKAKDQKPKPRTVPKSGKSACPRHAKNPFREGSAYGLLVDLLAQAGNKGISRDDLLKDFCKITKKPLQNAKYDLQVILSAATDSERLHRSCRDSLKGSIIREGSHYTIKLK